jgi:hypothetical protein|tara:strand:+ start:4678 stop:4908 length:231 start_codon:yes stop_codon:yes gene_type:complete
MAKYSQRYLKPEGWKTKGNWMVGVVWPVTGSTGKDYSVELHDKGFTCDCQGFGYHGYCKHSRGIVKKVNRAMNMNI